VTVESDEIPVILGETLVLRCAAVGVPIPTITWMKNNRPLQTSDRITISDDGGELVITDAIPQDAADYQCVGRNPAGTATAVIMLWGEGGWCLTRERYDTFTNHKNYNLLDCDWFKKSPIFD